jgi:hypothetical protein
MTDQHPITPPPELVEQWYQKYDSFCRRTPFEVYIATQAAQWGADQELAACCEWLYEGGKTSTSDKLRDARRPKPSLKEQALKALETLNQPWIMPKELEAVIAIRRALEALPND